MATRAEIEKTVAILISEVAPDARVAELLGYCFGRVMVKRFLDGKATPTDTRALRHISDWIAGAVASGERWLENLDDRGRPKKLMKFGSVEAIIAEADRAMIRLARNTPVAVATVEDEAVHMTLANGYSFVRLLTPEALDRESRSMQHCIGNGSYDRSLNEGVCIFLSLRDPAGNPHATLEVDVRRRVVVQCQGKQNAPPVRQYMMMVGTFLEETGYRFDDNEWSDGFLVDADNRLVFTDSLPETLRLPGPVLVRGAADLPKVLEASEIVWIMAEAETTAERISVRENFSCMTPSGKPVAGAIRVGGNASLRQPAASFTSMCDDIEVGGRLIFEVGDGPFELPGRIRTGGDLIAKGAGIGSIPDGTVVGGSLVVQWANVMEFPVGLRVGGSIEISKTPLVTLGDLRHVGGDLNVRGTRLASLPDGLNVEGNLVIAATDIVTLPEGLVVGGDFHLVGTQVLEIRSGIVVGGSLDARNSRLRHIRDGADIRGEIILDACSVETVPKTVTLTGRFLARCETLGNLPETLKAGTALLGPGRWTALPNRIEAGDLMINASGAQTWPETIIVSGDMVVVSARNPVFPEGMSVGGALTLTDSAVWELPGDFSVGALTLRRTDIGCLLPPGAVRSGTVEIYEDYGGESRTVTVEDFNRMTLERRQATDMTRRHA